MYKSSGSQVLRTMTVIQSRLDTLEESRAALLKTVLGGIGVSCFKLAKAA